MATNVKQMLEAASSGPQYGVGWKVSGLVVAARCVGRTAAES
jgi:hypothetical protein